METTIILRARLLLCVSIRGSIVSANRFSNHVVRHLLLCGSISFGHVLEFIDISTKSCIGLKCRCMLTQEEMPTKTLSMDALKVPLRTKVNANTSR